MPLCNRVTPFGEIVAHPARYPPASAVFGNRGVLHDGERNVVRQHAGRMWLACKLHVDRTRKIQRDDNRAFNGRKRVLMTPRRYTELFFLDEPTAMSAGHRPCACCRHNDFKRFMATWSSAHKRQEVWTAAAVDAVLHSERLAPAGGGKRTHSATLEDLPNGVMVRLDNSEAWLVWYGELHRWSHCGYDAQRAVASLGGQTVVDVLTPRSLVSVLRAGFEPGLPHPRALSELVPVEGTKTMTESRQRRNRKLPIDR